MRLETLRVGVTISDVDDALDVGPRIVHEVSARELFDHVAAGPDALDGDVFPRWELTLWEEDERSRWPLDVLAIPRDLADKLLDDRLLEHSLDLDHPAAWKLYGSADEWTLA